MQSKVCVSLSKARTHIHIYIEIKRTQSYLVFYFLRPAFIQVANYWEICILLFKPAGLCYIWITFLFCPAHALFFTAALIPDFMYRCVLVGLLFNFLLFTATTVEQLLPRLALPSPFFFFFFFIVGLCCLTRVEESLFHRVRKQRVHEVWWLVSGAFSDFFAFLRWAGCFFGGWGGVDGGERRMHQTHPSLTFHVVACTHFILCPLLPQMHTHSHTTIFQKRE